MAANEYCIRFPAVSQFDRDQWPQMRAALARVFLSQHYGHWREVLEGSDACFAPVLSPSQAALHPHNTARGNFVSVGGVLQPRAAPRFSLFPNLPVNPVNPHKEFW